jgi:2C-methyl-D-erythritol 2,4-cyclodiphosphate synthase
MWTNSPHIVAIVLSMIMYNAAEGYKLIIGGVEIPHTKGCEAHSDGELHLETTIPRSSRHA